MRVDLDEGPTVRGKGRGVEGKKACLPANIPYFKLVLQYSTAFRVIVIIVIVSVDDFTGLSSAVSGSRGLLSSRFLPLPPFPLPLRNPLEHLGLIQAARHDCLFPGCWDQRGSNATPTPIAGPGQSRAGQQGRAGQVWREEKAKGGRRRLCLLGGRPSHLISSGGITPSRSAEQRRQQQ